MNLFVTYFLLLFGISNGRPPECIFHNNLSSGGGTEGMAASCNIRLYRENLLIQTADGKRLPLVEFSSDLTFLSINCKKEVNFASVMDPVFLSKLSKLEELSITHCKFIHIPDNTLTGLYNIRRLTISSHYEYWPEKSLTLKKLSFAKLSRLEMLNLSFNNIYKLPEGSLCEMPSLKELNLSYNKLQSFDGLGLNGNKDCYMRLHQVLLSNNAIENIDIEHKLFTEVRSLSLKDNKLTWISGSSLHKLPELRNFDLSNNYLEGMSFGSFSSLSQLRGLTLANNTLTTLPSECFRNLEHLLSLNMSMNKIDFIIDDNSLFEGLIRLVVLDLSNNAITHIPFNLFNDIYSLQVLYLNNNLISVINDNTFSTLVNLHSMDISYNRVYNVSDSTFSGLKVLALLNASHNSLTSIHFKAFENCSSLVEIDLSVNKLAYIPKALSKASHLKRINMSSNRLSTVDGTSLVGMRHLESLILSHNNIRRIDENSFRILPSLQTIDLSFNFVSHITNNTLSAARNLSFLSIANNRLNNLYGMLLSVDKLTVLNASSNVLEWFDYAMLPQNIKTIDISNNKIRKLGNHYRLQDQMKLRTLFANNNTISEINSLSVPNSIRKLYLRDNIIEFVASNTFREKKFISHIDLSNNKIALLSESSVRLSLALNQFHEPYIFLAGNPLECDCEANWLLKVLQRRNSSNEIKQNYLPSIGDSASTNCKLPGIWNGETVSLLAVSSNNFLCTYRRHCFSVCHCCDFDACDCEQTCPQNCSCYHDHTWEHNIVDCGDAHFNEIPNGLPMDVTESFIDGNNFTVLSAHSLIGKKNLHTLYLNHSFIKGIESKAFKGLPKLVILKLDNNLIDKLQGDEFESLNSLKELHLNNNELFYIPADTFAMLYSLQFLSLHNNKLTTFPLWKLSENTLLNKLSIQNNMWSCDCTFVTRLGKWLRSVDLEGFRSTKLLCAKEQLSKMNLDLKRVLSECRVAAASQNIHTVVTYDYIMLISIGITAILLLLIGILISYTYSRRAKSMFSVLTKFFSKKQHLSDRKLKLFDFFISHSAKDTAWVCGCLLPEFEQRGYSSCLAHRDSTYYQNGIELESLKENILCCRRILIILSKNFLYNDWNDRNFRLAHIIATKEFKRNKMTCLLTEQIEITDIDSELAVLIKRCSKTIQPRGESFWNDLKKLIPYRRNLLPPSKLNESSCNAPLLSSKSSSNCFTFPKNAFKQNLSIENTRFYLNNTKNEFNIRTPVDRSDYCEYLSPANEKVYYDIDAPFIEAENPYMVIADLTEDKTANGTTTSRQDSLTANPTLGNELPEINSENNVNKGGSWIQDPHQISSSSKHVFFV